jgi:transcriptional regulator with XRE-family HTH domain
VLKYHRKAGVKMTEVVRFSSFLKDARIKAGYDRIEDLAKVCGISGASLSRMENDKQKPYPRTLEKLAPFLKISYSDLMQAVGYIEDKQSGAFIMIYGSDGKKLDISDLSPGDQDTIFSLAEHYKNRKK